MTAQGVLPVCVPYPDFGSPLDDVTVRHDVSLFYDNPAAQRDAVVPGVIGVHCDDPRSNECEYFFGSLRRRLGFREG
jgi:hypothetical protein